MECRLMTAGPERLSPLRYEEIAGCGGSTTVVSKALKDFPRTIRLIVPTAFS